MRGQDLVMLPGPVNVTHDVLSAMSTPMFNHRGEKFSVVYRSVKQKVRKVLRSSGEVYFVTGSGTAGNEFAVSNLVAPKEKVAVFTNGFFSDRLRDTFRAYGAEVIEIASQWGAGLDIERFEAVAGEVSLAAAVFNETSTGIVNQIRDMAKIASQHGLLTIVDNVSGVGNRYDMDGWGVDATVTASQKGLGAPPGMAIVVLSDRAREKAKKIPKRSYYFNFDLFEKYAQEDSTPATPAISVMCALDASLQNIMEEGVDNFEERHRVSASALRAGALRCGLELFGDPELASNTVTALKLPGKARAVVKTMLERYGVAVSAGLGKYREDVLRIGHMGSVDVKDIVATLSALELSLKELGIRADGLGEGVSSALQVYSGAPPEKVKSGEPQFSHPFNMKR
ncbi:MAG: alanine--glyoxylate aminotransferase family protein [Candidatus Marsarchaeota archaeon]|nr:alanine--glyoxylate aminotransferase family protein [Candidatus Marsarchaeota archaeon]